MANSLVPQFQAGFDFDAVCEHGGLHLARLEDEHSSFSTTMRYDLIVFFNEASFIIEPYLHALFHYLADRDQIFRDGWDMQEVLDVVLFSVILKWNISDMLNGVNCVVPSFNIAP